MKRGASLLKIQAEKRAVLEVKVVDEPVTVVVSSKGWIRARWPRA